MPETTPESVTLAEMIRDLDGYITRRAEELAKPLIEQANAAADLRVRDAERDLERERDVLKECRRRLAVASTAQDTVRVAAKRLATALGHGPYAPPPLEALVAEAERRLAEQDGVIERLKAEALGRVLNPIMRDIPLPELEA